MMFAALAAGLGAGLLSAPHCAGMCGPIAAYAGHHARGDVWRYQAGRILSYGLLGALSGQLGQVVSDSLQASNASVILSWSFAAVLIGGAVQLWRRSRAAATRNDPLHDLSAPQARGQRSTLSWGQRVSRIALGLLRGRREPWLIGLLSVLLPCGALWAGVLIAAGFATPLAGALCMIGFALTSSVGLLGAGWLARRLRAVHNPIWHRVLAMGFALGALFFVVRPFWHNHRTHHGHRPVDQERAASQKDARNHASGAADHRTHDSHGH